MATQAKWQSWALNVSRIGGINTREGIRFQDLLREHCINAAHGTFRPPVFTEIEALEQARVLATALKNAAGNNAELDALLADISAEIEAATAAP